jgi:Flp pilus assembly protein protease CpaA
MIEVIFLIALALIWMIFATVSDIRTTEIPNWLNFSLVIFALGFRLIYSIFSGDFNFIYQGLIGFGIFFALENLLYYSRAFAGGDAKLMLSLGAILPFSGSFIVNIEIFLSFLFLFLSVGAFYGLFSSSYFAIKNFDRFKVEFRKQNKKFRKFSALIMISGLGIMILGLLSRILIFYLGILIFLLPLLYVYSKSVDEACMIKEKVPEKLREGDWLYKSVKVKGKTIKANWNGLSQEDIKLLKKSSRKVTIREGIAFSPVFLIGFLLLLYFYFVNTGLWNSLW